MSPSDRGVLLGLDFGGTKIACAVADASGRILGRTDLATHPERGAEAAVARAVRAAQELRDTVPGELAGVGVSTMGITFEDHVEIAPNVPGWAELRLPGTMCGAFPGVPLQLDNDVKAAGLAEVAWGALRDVRHGVYVNLGSGIAAALVIDGAVVRGAHGAAGEIGYWRRTGSSTEEQFEPFAGGAGVRERARAELGIDGGYAGLLASNDVRAQAMADEVITEICCQITNLAIVLDPAVVAIGGGYARSPEPLLQRLRAALVEGVPYPPEVVIGRFAGDGGLHGALALARTAAGYARDTFR